MKKQNCWEFKKCGREIGGINADKEGVCPAACNIDANDFCGGKNGGRACIYITGTLCDNSCQTTYQKKEKLCNQCEFYALLKKEHPEEMAIFSYFDYIIKHSKKGKKSVK